MSPTEMKYEARITDIAVVLTGEPIWSEFSTTVSITDEGAGEFVSVSQSNKDNTNKISFDAEEWPILRSTINRMIRSCRVRD